MTGKLITGSAEAEAAVDMNGQVIRMAIAILVKRAGGSIVFRPEELRDMMRMDADLNFTPFDDGTLEFTLKEIAAPQGIRLT